MSTNSYNEHGGNVWAVSRLTGIAPRDIIDLSTCVSDDFPASILPILYDTSINKLLPDPFSKNFSWNYAEKYDTPVDNVLLTSGTTELIERVCQIYSGKRCSMLSPTYSDYEKYATQYNLNQHIIKSSNDFLSAKSDVYFICNPNNPTGELISNKIILELSAANPNSLIVVDESYMPFVEEDQSLEFDYTDNILVLRSFSKLFGLPGLRIGYATGASHHIDKIKGLISPWSVNTIGQVVAIELLSLAQIPVKGLKMNDRTAFFSEVQKFAPLITPIVSSTHFFLAKLGAELPTANIINTIFNQHGVMLRDCTNIRGLGDRYIRLSTRNGWRSAIPILERICGGS